MNFTPILRWCSFFCQPDVFALVDSVNISTMHPNFASVYRPKVVGDNQQRP